MEDRRKFIDKASKATVITAASLVGIGCSDVGDIQAPQFARVKPTDPIDCSCTQLSVLDGLQNQINALNSRVFTLEQYILSGSGG